MFENEIESEQSLDHFMQANFDDLVFRGRNFVSQ
jgi:hypothetical protein